MDTIFKETEEALKLIQENIKRIKADLKYEKEYKDKYYKKYLEEKRKNK